MRDIGFEEECCVLQNSFFPFLSVVNILKKQVFLYG
jgi:hypothetical protein